MMTIFIKLQNVENYTEILWLQYHDIEFQDSTRQKYFSNDKYRAALLDRSLFPNTVM